MPYLIKPRVVEKVVEKAVYYRQTPTQEEELSWTEEFRLGASHALSEEPSRTEVLNFGDTLASAEEPAREETITIKQE